MNNTNKRDETIDFFKGLLILGVIWGHTITALSLDHFNTGVWIHRFFRVYDMPFFMLLSGFFISRGVKKYSLKTLLINRTGMLLIPIVVWNIAGRTYNLMNFYFLWAVFISSIICVIGFYIRNRLNWGVGEFIFYVLFVLSLHKYNVPWNIFYLFPFFCYGYYMKDVRFEMTSTKLVVLWLIVSLGMCFWQVKFNPWNCSWDAWKVNEYAVLIYIYRFVLSIATIYLIANLFKMLYKSITGGFKRVILHAGKETLAIYVLQYFIIEVILHKLMCLLKTDWYNINVSIVQNVIGYFVAPIIAFLSMVAMLYLIKIIKRSRWTNWVFGIKLL